MEPPSSVATGGAISHICLTQINEIQMVSNRVVGVVVVCRVGMLAVRGSQQGYSFVCVLFSNCFLFYYLVSSLGVNLGLN